MGGEGDEWLGREVQIRGREMLKVFFEMREDGKAVVAGSKNWVIRDPKK